jgi:uncharacterized protein with GYD domain
VPTYILLSSLTSEGRKTLQDNPQRLDRVNDEVEAFGCTVIDQYAVLGPYDFVTLIEAPNNAVVAQLSLDLGARGTINILTLPAIPIDDFEAQLRNGPELGQT